MNWIAKLVNDLCWKFRSEKDKVLYQSILCQINEIVADTEKDDREFILNYFLSIFKVDFQTKGLLDIVHRKDCLIKHYITANIIPISREIDKERLFNARTGEKTMIDFSKQIVVVFPYKKNSLKDGIRTINKVPYDRNVNYIEAKYYDLLDLTYVSSGIHHTAVAIQKRKGNIIADVVRCSELFEKLCTDGQYWYHKKTMKVISKVEDYRIALIFRLGADLYFLKHPEKLEETEKRQ